MALWSNISVNPTRLRQSAYLRR
nr:DUF1010 domain-containing protein [Paracidovorax avenae]